MPKDLYSDEDLIAMSKEAEAVGDLINAIDQLLHDEAKGSSQPPKDVIHLDLKIKTEFQEVMTNHKKTSLMTILKFYHDWAERTFVLGLRNSGRLQKGKLREHVLEARDIVATIVKILPKN